MNVMIIEDQRDVREGLAVLIHGTPGFQCTCSYRTMEGFGIHTFRLINAQGKATFVRFHWKPVAGKASLIWDESQKLTGRDPDFHRCYRAVGDFPDVSVLGLKWWLTRAVTAFGAGMTPFL